MSRRLNNAVFAVAGSFVSVIEPSDPNHRTVAQAYGVADPVGQLVVGLSPDYPDVVLVGTREQLVAAAREMLTKLRDY